MLHPPPQSVVVGAELHHLVLRLYVANLRLVPAFTHGHVVALPPHPVLRAALVDVLLGLPSSSPPLLQQLQAALLRVLVRVLVVVRARHRGRRRSWVSRLEVHGGLRAVRNLVLEVRRLLLLGMLGVLLGMRVRVVVGGGHSRVQVLVVPGLLLDGHRSDARRVVLVQRLQLGLHVVGHVELLGPRATRPRLVLSVHHLELLLPGAVVEQVGQEVVVESRRVDVRAQVDGGFVVPDLTAEVCRVSVAGGGLLAVGQAAHLGSGRALVQVRELHGESKPGQTWRGAPGIQFGEGRCVSGPRVRGVYKAGK